MSKVLHHTTDEDTPVDLMAYVLASDRQAVQQADLASITYKTFDADTPGTVENNGTLTIANVVFDTLQTDAGWTVGVNRDGSTGYNFLFPAPGTLFSTGGKTIHAEVTMTETGGATYTLQFIVKVKELLSS